MNFLFFGTVEVCERAAAQRDFELKLGAICSPKVIVSGVVPGGPLGKLRVGLKKILGPNFIGPLGHNVCTPMNADDSQTLFTYSRRLEMW